jgi:hypothetical protein
LHHLYLAENVGKKLQRSGGHSGFGKLNGQLTRRGVDAGNIKRWAIHISLAFTVAGQRRTYTELSPFRLMAVPHQNRSCPGSLPYWQEHKTPDRHQSQPNHKLVVFYGCS